MKTSRQLLDLIKNKSKSFKNKSTISTKKIFYKKITLKFKY